MATIANATSALDYVKWDGWGLAPTAWAVVMLIAGTVIAMAMSLTRGDAAYVLVILWAFAGIAVKQAGTPVVANTAWAASGVALIALVAGALVSRRKSPPAATG